jgi:hypothetical protein
MYSFALAALNGLMAQGQGVNNGLQHFDEECHRTVICEAGVIKRNAFNGVRTVRQIAGCRVSGARDRYTSSDRQES